MPNTSIGGLVSGLDTATIISQLMQLEARPQTMLKSRVSSEQRAVNALQTLNSKLANLTTKATELSKLDSWSPMKTTSSNDKITVSADASATLTSLSFSVVATATQSRAVFNTEGTAGAAVTAAGADITISYDDPDRDPPTATFNTGTGSLTDIAAAINDQANETGLRATLVKTGGTGAASTYQLHVVSTETGTMSGFTIGDGTFLGGAATTGGADAEITVNAKPLTSHTNTFEDLMPGVDVTLAPEAKGDATLTIAKDAGALATKVKGMVDAVNAALDDLSSLTASGADVKSRGLLAGDTTLRGVRNQLIESVTGGIGGESLATVGIQVDRNGKLTFDEAKFKTAYAADPTGTQTLIAGTDPASGTDTGFADKLAALGKAFSNSIDGTVTLTIKSRQSSIKGMEDDIADWDIRLETRQAALQRQYTALESALGKLQSQGNWLAGQIASLPKMSSGQ